MSKFIEKITKIVRFPLLLAGILILTGLFQYLLMMKDVRGEHYDLKLFQVSPDTIRSVKTVEDTEKTEKEREEAASEVEPVYTYSEEKGKNTISMLNTLFDDLIDRQKKVADTKEKERSKALNEQIKSMQSDLAKITDNENKIELNEADLKLLLTSSESELKTAQQDLVKAVERQMSSPIREDRLMEARASVERTIRYSSTFPSKLQGVGIRIGRAALVVNETKDEKATKERMDLARASVDPTKILQGQIIVQEGQVIDRNIYRQLQLTGLLSDDASIKPKLGLGILILLQMLFFYASFAANKRKADTEKTRDVLITSLIYLLSIILMQILNLIDGEFDVIVGFLFPAAVAPLLLRILVSERAAILATIMLGLSAGVIFQEGYSTVIQMELALYMIISGLASVVFTRRIENRSKILTASFQVAGINVLFIAFYLLLTQSNYTWNELSFYLIAALFSAILSGALAIGSLPFIESGFGIISSFRLIELSNPNHPLLKKILMEAPGTYHHSLMVANLAEAACEAIGANGLLARVGCYYHDIGKTRRPGFFVENQMNGFNPHDQLPPDASSDIIIAHVEDGVKILEKHKMPREIIDVAQQHHGTTLVKFFYYKAKELDEKVEEEQFRYSGPKPQSKENAIICIADSVEAAVRSMKEPSAEKIRDLVHAIAQDKLMDGQLDECDLSIKELKIIEKVFCETLNGTFHSRIEYPKQDKA